MAAKQQVVKIVFQGDTALIKRAENEIRRETKITQDQIRHDQNKTIKNLFDQTNKIKGHFSNLSNKTLGVLGLGFGLHGLVSSAGQFIGQIGRVGDELTGLSDQFGSVNKAVGIYYSGLGSSFASMGQVKSAMMELGNEGIKLDDNFKSLTFAVADFSQITGVSTSAIANLAGEIKGFGMATAKDMRGLLNDVVSIGLHGHQATQVIQSIGKAVENLAYFAGDGSKSIKALSKGISETTSFLTKMGVKAQTATTFMEKLTDPEQYGEMASLLNRINISQADYFNMLRSESGKENFFNKLQQNLPVIADQIMAINNPMAQREFAKSIGLPMEIAAKLAGKTKSEIQQIIGKSMTDKKALEKKESQAKANQERFTETLEMFKMQALMPLMQFMVRNIPNFMKFASLVSQFVNKALGMATGYMSKFQGTVDKVFKDSNSLGELLANAIAPIFDGLTTIIGDALAAFLSPKNWANIFSSFWNLFTKMPLWAQLLGGFLIFKRIGGFMSGLVNGFKRGLTPAAPQFVKEVGGGVSGFGGKGGTLRKLGKMARRSGGGIKGLAKAGGRMLTSGIGSMLGSASGLLGTLARFAGPIGLAITSLTTLYSVFNTYTNATNEGKQVLKDAGMAFISMFTPLGITAKNAQKLTNGLGILLGTQEHYNDALTGSEVVRRKELKSIAENTKLTKTQQEELDKLNAKMEKSSTSMSDIFGQIFAKIGGIFSTDSLMAAKISLALSNFGTWLGSGISAMLRGASRIKNKLTGNDYSDGEKTAADNFEKVVDIEIAKASSGQGSSHSLQNLLNNARVMASVGSQSAKDFYTDKMNELQDRVGSMRLYESRVQKQREIEAAQRHVETTRLLGGIAGSTAKTADNTSPAKDPVREAFKEIAITNAQMLETQYAGSNFTSK